MSTTRTPNNESETRDKKKGSRHREPGFKKPVYACDTKRKLFVSEKFGSEDYKLKVMFANETRRIPGFVSKLSTRWYSNPFPKGKVWFTIPYFDILGRWTGLTVARWYCHPIQYFASLLATIISRLRTYALRHNKMYLVNKHTKHICAASFIYLITKDLYGWNRTLFFFRNLKKRASYIHPPVLRKLLKTDESTRFVYSQAIYNANWLTSRVKRPRDKSAKGVRHPNPENKDSLVIPGDDVDRYEMLIKTVKDLITI